MSVLSGIGSLLGAVSGMAGANTGYSSSNTASSANQSGTTNGQSVSTFNPLQQGVQGTTAGALKNFITNGPNLTPAMTTGTDAINSTYKGIGDSLQQSLASRGFGNSGASGTAALQTGVAKTGAVGNLQAQLQASAQAQQLQAMGEATGFGFAAPGQTSSGTTTGSSTGTQQTNGSYTMPSSPLAGMLSGGATSLVSGMQGATGSLPSWMTSLPWSSSGGGSPFGAPSPAYSASTVPGDI